MALYREPNICPFCCEEIKGIYLDQSGIPEMMRLIGDTFLRYEEHTCKEGTKIFESPTEEQEYEKLFEHEKGY